MNQTKKMKSIPQTCCVVIISLPDIDEYMKQEFSGPRFLIRNAGLEMHPLDQGNRLESIKNEDGIGLCNITKCCTFACPEHIEITDNAIIPMKERVVDEYYDPLKWIWNSLIGKSN